MLIKKQIRVTHLNSYWFTMNNCFRFSLIKKKLATQNNSFYSFHAYLVDPITVYFGLEDYATYNWDYGA